MCPGDSARRAGWQASPGGRGLLMGAIPSERVLDERGPRRAGTCTRPPARGPWRVAPGARIPACDPDTRTSACELASRPVPMPQSLCPKGACRATCAKGSCWSTNANGAGWPPCSSSLRAGLCKGLLSWQDVAEMCSRAFSHGNMLPWCVSKRSAMAIYRLDAFSSVQLWQ